MADFLVSAAIGLLFVAVATAIVIGSYFGARAALGLASDEDRTHDAAAGVATRIAALYGLVLALVYAQELDAYKDVRAGLTAEAVAIADVFNDVHRYGGPAVQPVREGLARYVAEVVDEEWGLLGAGAGLSAKAWSEWDGVYERLLDLEPATDRERYLAGRMRDRITSVASFRQLREATTLGQFSALFWGPALIGLALLAVPLYVFRPTRTHLMLFTLFGAYSGVILFFIYGFANPFAEPGRLEPAPFEELLRGDLGRSLPAG